MIDAPPRPVRQRDLIQHRAMVAALHSVSQICPDLDFPTVSYIIEQYEASVAEQHLDRQYAYEQKRTAPLYIPAGEEAARVTYPGDVERARGGK